MTSDNDTEIYENTKEIVSSTDGLGLIHESISSVDQSSWSRQWFSWVNGLFGQMVLGLARRKPELLSRSYQYIRYFPSSMVGQEWGAQFRSCT